MFFFTREYFWFLGAIIICLIISGIASAKVRSAYKEYGKIPNRSGMTGYDTAERLLRLNGINGISIGRVRKKLSDHYHPKKRKVNLSPDTYDKASIAAVAVAAHEIGHVMQKEKGYFLYKMRTALVPIVNIGTNLAMPLVLLGVLIDALSLNADSETGFHLAILGVILYSTSLIFTLVTLPVELNASRRAKNMLLEAGVLSEDEMPGVRKVLSAAAMTYLAALLTSLVYFLRFLVRVLLIFGKRRR